MRAEPLMHGKTSPIHSRRQGRLRAASTSPFTATRYHSLPVDGDEPAGRASRSPPGPTTARSWACGTEAGPIHGVQFHPEIIATECGHELLDNFLDMAGREPRRPGA